MVAFSHLDPGTPEAVWADDGRIFSAPALDTDVDDLIVVAAHPDDETLGAGGLIRIVHENGGRVSVVIATDGEASHPDSPTRTPEDLAATRRREVVAALDLLAPGARVHFLGLPDGGLRENVAQLDAALTGILDSVVGTDPSRALSVAPWSGDGHRDHRIAAESTSRAAAARGIRHLGYPIWLWHWGTPADVPWERAAGIEFTLVVSEAKERALRAHVSQVRPLSDAAGDEPIVSAQMAGHFARDSEIFLAEPSLNASMDASWFESFYARNDDPWGFETRWYEQRKRALLMGVLPVPDLGSVLEIGCSTGRITIDLAERATSVTALDASAAALDAARVRVGDIEAVTLRQAAVPQDFPSGTFDTIVLSEVGYYLSMPDLHRTIALIDSAMNEGGFLVACHWRHPVAEYPLTGDQVHRALRAMDTWHRLALHEEADFVLEVFARRPDSVAQREGLA